MQTLKNLAPSARYQKLGNYHKSLIPGPQNSVARFTKDTHQFIRPYEPTPAPRHRLPPGFGQQDAIY